MIQSIQALRALAALGIILFHSGGKISELSSYTYHNPLVLGQSGVDLFFIISGFVMAHTLESNRSNNALQFLVRRFMRIVPLYWFMTTVYIALLLLTPNIFQSYRFDLWHSVYSYLFLPQTDRPVVSIGWTLVYVMYFYIVLAICIAVGCRRRILLLPIGFLSFYILGLCVPEYKIYPFFELITSEFLLEISAGLILYEFYKKGFRASLFVSITLIASGILLFPILETLPRLLSYGLPMTLIFCGVVLSQRELINVPVLHYLGDSSYSLFLIQVFTVPACGVLTSKLGINTCSYPFILLVSYSIITVIAAVGLYIVIERPMNSFLNILFKNIFK